MALEYVIRYAGERVDGPDRPIADFELALEAGTVGSFSMTLPPSHPMASPDSFRCEDPTSEVTFSERYHTGEEVELFRGWVTQTRLDTDLMLTVECDGMLAYLSDTIVRPFACRALEDLPAGTVVTSDDPFVHMVVEHNLHCQQGAEFEVGRNPRVGPVDAVTDWRTTWEAMNDALCEGRDRFLYARTGDTGLRYIDLLDGGAGEGTQAIVLGENVVEMDATSKRNRVATAIVARGTTDDTYNDANGDRIDRRSFGLDEVDIDIIVGNASNVSFEGDRAVNWDMVEAYGLREEKRDYEAATPGELATAVAADLNPDEIGAREVRSLDVRAVDLHALNPTVQPLRFLDWCEVFIRAEGSNRLIAHEWLPLTKLRMRPRLEDSEYHFGDLEQTLTRRSALRIGMLRRGNGSLVRKADGEEWNNDRVWNRTDDVWDHADEGDDKVREELQQAVDTWSQHLDDETAQWYQSLEDAKREDAQGREELLKHMDEIEGLWKGEIEGIEETVDENHRQLLDGLREVALESQRTFFGICDTYGDLPSKVVFSENITKPGNEEFVLSTGAVIDIKFLHRNASLNPTLNVGGTRSIPIYTNGEWRAAWQDGAIVRFLYDGDYWQCCSNDIYGSTVTVGNPAQANFFTNGYEAELRIGGESYCHAGMDGARIGLLDRAHVDIGDSTISFQNATAPDQSLEIGWIQTAPSIYENGIIAGHGLEIMSAGGKYEAAGQLFLGAGGFATLRAEDVTLAGGTVEVGTPGTLKTGLINFWSDGMCRFNNFPIVQKTLVLRAGGDAYLTISQGQLGLNTLWSYAFFITNGDRSAYDFFVVGSEVSGDGNVIVKFDRDVPSGTMIRLNIFGIQCDVTADYLNSGDPGVEGPGIFAESASTTDTEEVA